MSTVAWVVRDCATGCWTRINGDDERRPITFEAAAEPVPWDTAALPAGTWVVEAYTWEPWFNLWTEHPGVFRIVDDPDPAANPPAAALRFAEQVVQVGDEASISGCVAAMDGATMRDLLTKICHPVTGSPLRDMDECGRKGSVTQISTDGRFVNPTTSRVSESRLRTGEIAHGHSRSFREPSGA